MNDSTLSRTRLGPASLMAVGCALAASCSVTIEPLHDAALEPPADASVERVLDSGAAADSGQPADATEPDSGVAADSGQAADAMELDAAADVGAPPAMGWLRVAGNKILRADGTVWRGRGANLPDTRGCDACSWDDPRKDEVIRRLDELVDGWGANFVRLLLESYAQSDGRTHWQGVLDDPAYLADLQAIVAHAAAKPDLYVMVSLWIDPSFSAEGWPTDGTIAVWRKLAETFRDQPRVLFGLVNEPEYNFDGAQDAQVWEAMNRTVAAIREVEDSSGSNRHLVAVQGTGGWSRRLDYYVTHPITAGGGANVVYEIHVYDPAAIFGSMLGQPAKTLPVVVGEFGPAEGYMTVADCQALMELMEAREIPHLGWAFHQRCSPDLIKDYSSGGCGVGMALEPTDDWGVALRGWFAKPW